MWSIDTAYQSPFASFHFSKMSLNSPTILKVSPNQVRLTDKNPATTGRNHGGGGEGTHFMHSGSLKTLNLRIPPMPTRNMSDAHRSGRHRAHQTRSAVVRCSARRVSCILLRTTTCGVASRILCVLSCIYMDNSFESVGGGGDNYN